MKPPLRLNFTVVALLAGFSLAIFIILHFILPHGVQTIDPCSATPGIQYTWWLAVVPVVDAALWFLLKKTPSLYMHKCQNVYVFTTLFLVPLCAYFLAFIFINNASVRHSLSQINLAPHVYYYGCYGELETNPVYLNSLASFMVFVFAIVVFSVSALKNNKR